jgi:hypothetical protein
MPAVPFIVKAQLEKIGCEKLGRQLMAGAVDLKPWTLELTLHDLAIAKAGSANAAEVSQLKIKRLYIDAELQSLLRLAPVADALVVEDPSKTSPRWKSCCWPAFRQAKTPCANWRCSAVWRSGITSLPGGLPTARFFLGAVKAVPPEAKWTPRAELNLATP